MGISEKVAYLKGLMEGMNLNADSNEGKLFLAIADVLDEIALEVEDLTDEVMELGDGLDVISDDLGDVEDIVYDEDEDDYEDEEDDEDDEEECYATTCPECEEEIFFDDSVLEDGKVECPNCGATLEFDPADLVEDEEEKVKNKDLSLVHESVTDEEIARIISRWTGIPVAKLTQGERAKILALGDELHKRVRRLADRVHELETRESVNSLVQNDVGGVTPGAIVLRRLS